MDGLNIFVVGYFLIVTVIMLFIQHNLNLD